MKGFFGKFLDVNLSENSIHDYKVPDEWYERYLGGKGIGGRILFEELEAGTDPLGSGNIVVFATGPLQGTLTPGAGRHLVITKSPKTGGISDSYAGGYFAHELGTSGYDGILIRGKAEEPKYVSLVKGKAEIKNAEDLWGLPTADTEEELKNRHGDGKVSSIGVAGENLVNFSCIINDRTRAAGRPGLGAVLGSKKLKALFVKGGLDKPLYDEEKLKEARTEFSKRLSPAIEWGKYGTTGDIEQLNEMGILPTKNFQEGVFSGAGKITGQSMYEEILTERDTCKSCPVRCKRVVKTEFEGEEIEEKYGGPEYETVASFGSLCMNDDIDSIALANQKCNKYGLDTISTGNIIAFAMEASEKGLLDEEVEWGDASAIIDMIEKIAHREGIGKFLAQGIDEVAKELGADFAMEVKGQEIPMHEPRGKKALALSYATSPRGATHMEVLHDTFDEHPSELDIQGRVDRFDLGNKPKYCKTYEDLVSFSNSCIICAFTSWVVYFRNAYVYPEIREILNAATGLQVDKDKMMEIGERNFNLIKYLSSREGVTRKDDILPGRFEKSLPKGGSSTESIPKDEFQRKIDEYYELRGWNEEGPTKEKLEELDMAELTE